MYVAFLFACIGLRRWAFLLGLGKLFLESFGFSKGAWRVFRLRTEVSDGEGLTPPLHPRKGHSPLDPFLSSALFIG